MDDEPIQDRVDYLDDRKVRDILVRVIESLIANGDAVAASDVLCENCLLTNDEARRIYVASRIVRSCDRAAQG